MEAGLGIIFSFVFLALSIWFVVWLCILVPMRMARARERSAVIWVLVSLLFSPFLAILLLWILD